MSIVRSTRREFLRGSMALGAGIVTAGPLGEVLRAAQRPGSKMKFGLVTYLWGQYWDLPTVIANCEKAGVPGVELRTEHAHKVEANLTEAQRRDVKKRFADSKVTLVSLGTNFAFHYAEEDQAAKGHRRGQAVHQAGLRLRRPRHEGQAERSAQGRPLRQDDRADRQVAQRAGPVRRRIRPEGPRWKSTAAAPCCPP